MAVGLGFTALGNLRQLRPHSTMNYRGQPVTQLDLLVLARKYKLSKLSHLRGTSYWSEDTRRPDQVMRGPAEILQPLQCEQGRATLIGDISLSSSLHAFPT